MIRFKQLPNGGNLPLPNYATDGAAGMDICSAVTTTLDPGAYMLIPTGFAVEVPRQQELQVRPRSGLAYKHGVTVLNTPGTIDSDYRGEIGVILINHGSEPFQINRGDRIAQLVVGSVPQACPMLALELSRTERGEGGYGSTGV